MVDKKYKNDLKEIRSIMERSSTFISLSGLSGVLAGIYALIGAYLAHAITRSKLEFADKVPLFFDDISFYSSYLLIAFLVMLFSVVTGLYLTAKRAKTLGQSIKGKAAFRMILNIAFPMVVGVLFCIALLYHGFLEMVAPSMLIFYGLGLINGSKYTLNNIRWLGVIEVILGLCAAVFTRNGFLFWAMGFGVMHIVYGIYMYLKYEKNNG